MLDDTSYLLWLGAFVVVGEVETMNVFLNILMTSFNPTLNLLQNIHKPCWELYRLQLHNLDQRLESLNKFSKWKNHEKFSSHLALKKWGQSLPVWPDA